MTVKRYRKLPGEIDAVRWTGHNFDTLVQWCGDHIMRMGTEGRVRLFVKANSAWLDLTLGEWIARDSAGFYPIKDEIFLKSYEEVS